MPPEEDESALREQSQEIARDVVVAGSLVEEVRLRGRRLSIESKREVVNSVQVGIHPVRKIVVCERANAPRHDLVLVLGVNAKLAQRIEEREEKRRLGSRSDRLVRAQYPLQ